ncbi:hypothetical protein GCM10022214_30970 [Actinomadura miaoliensis]|uniref:Uncharacterized protein n=1 Tax=Actinomadura miaoliensis TaxID=430685 RepID=A0ABP7VR73_9ACTN
MIGICACLRGAGPHGVRPLLPHARAAEIRIRMERGAVEMKQAIEAAAGG